MKILHISKHCDRGHGNAQVAVDLACHQVSLGHTVYFASAGGTFSNLLDKCGVINIFVKQSGSAWSLLMSILLFIKRARRERPDIIHAHMMSSAIFGYIAAKLSGAILITTVHNSFDRHSYIMRLGAKVIAVSEAEREALLMRGFRSERVTAIINGPIGSPREIQGSCYSGPWARPCVTMVCGLHKRKGVRDVIAAFASVKNDFPHWHLNLIGDGPDRCELEALSKALEVPSQFLGQVDRPKELLKRSDIFISASYAEPCGLSIIEARVAGCAIIGTRVGGTPELLADGNAGLLVGSGNVGEIANALKELMEDAAVLEKWRAQALRGGEYFLLSRLSEDHLSLYDSCLACA